MAAHRPLLCPALVVLLVAVPCGAWGQEPSGAADSSRSGREAAARQQATADPVEAAPHRLVLDLEMPAREDGRPAPPIEFDAGEAGTRNLGALETLLADPVVVSLRTRTIDLVVHDRPVTFQFRNEGERGRTFRLEVGLLRKPRYDVTRPSGPPPAGRAGPAGSLVTSFDVETEVLELHLRGQGRLVAEGPDSTVLRVELPGAGGDGEDPSRADGARGGEGGGGAGRR